MATALALGQSPDFAGLSLSPWWCHQLETWTQNRLELLNHLDVIWLFYLNQKWSKMSKSWTGSGRLFQDGHCFGARSIPGLRRPLTRSTMVPPTWNLNTQCTWAWLISGCNLVILPQLEMDENVKILSWVWSTFWRWPLLFSLNRRTSGACHSLHNGATDLKLKHKIDLSFIIIWMKFGYSTSTRSGWKCPNSELGFFSFHCFVSHLAKGGFLVMERLACTVTESCHAWCLLLLFDIKESESDTIFHFWCFCSLLWKNFSKFLKVLKTLPFCFDSVFSSVNTF